MKSKQMLLLLLSPILVAACNGSNNTSNNPSSNVSTNSIKSMRLVSSVPDHLPIELKNNTKIIPDDHIYVIAIAKTDEEHPRQCLVNFTDGSCKGVTSSEEVDKLSKTKLSDLPEDENKNRIFHVEHVQSGRIYFSINQPLSLYFDKQTNTIPDPDGFKTRDPNYYTLYDKVEFSFVKYGVWFNPTAVDFFSLPIEITDKSSDTVKEAGLNISRVDVFKKAHEIFSENDKTTNHEWSKLFLKYTNSNNVVSDIRLMAPGKAMVEIGGQEYNPFNNKTFAPDYLENSTKFGFNYLEALWTYYKKNTIKIDVSELEGQKDANGVTLPVACDGGAVSLKNYIFVGKVDAITNKFVFTNKSGENDSNSCTVSINIPKSISFFAGAVGEFDAPNNTPKAIIVREMTSAFDVGLLPAPDGTIFSLPKAIKNSNGYYIPNENNYLIKNLYAGKYYQPNTYLADAGRNSGPWYDLYSKALHSFGSGIRTFEDDLPYEHDGKGAIYTFAYDDALGQDGTIHEGNGKNPGKVTVTLGDLSGSVIPQPLTEKHGFNVNIILPEALYTYKKLDHVPTGKSDFSGFDMVLDTSSGSLYQFKDGNVVKLTLSPEEDGSLNQIVKMPQTTVDEESLFNQKMKEFLIKNKDAFATQGLPLNEITGVIENGPDGEVKLHDSKTGANELNNVSSPIKLKFNNQDVLIYLDPYIVLPNNPEFDGIKLENTTKNLHEVQIILPGNKPKNL